MTYEEAKAFFEENLKDGKCSENCPECTAMELAISALEKQIPKKPDLDDGVYCPCCLHEFKVHYATRYCTNCGQAIDWSDTE